MAVPTSFFAMQFSDYGHEISSMSVAVTALTAGNLVAQAALHDTLRSAVEAVSLCALVQLETVQDRHRVAAPGTGASNKEGQREKKWLVRYYDGTDFTQYTTEIPGADLDLLETHADEIDMLDPTIASVWTDFKDAFEAVVRSPNGNLVVVTEVVYSGRNN